MKINLCAILIIGTLLHSASLFAEDSILMNLQNADRQVRKKAAKRLEAFSQEQLIQVARDCAKLVVQPGEQGQQCNIYVFHQILSVAQNKGMSLSDVVDLLGDKNTEAAFQMCLFDWIRETGAKHIQPSDGIKLLDALTPYFVDRADDLQLRKMAHSAIRAICAELHGSLTLNRLEASDAEKVKKRIRKHVEAISQVFSDEEESDDAIQAFAPLRPTIVPTQAQGSVMKANCEQASRSVCRSETEAKNARRL